MYLYQMDVGEYLVSIFIEDGDRAGKKILSEAKQRGAIHLIGKYSANIHPPHIPQGRKHIEVYARNNVLFAMNDNGTGHDGYRGTPIPNKVAKVLRRDFPEFRISPNRIIESLEKIELDDKQKRLLNMLLNYLIR